MISPATKNLAPRTDCQRCSVVGKRTPRLGCSALLALFLVGFFLSSAGEVLAATHAAGEAPASHEEGSSCPDPARDGEPCGPACPCACCPGHRLTVACAGTEPFVPAPPPSDLFLALPTVLHPREIGQRIFHPPRA